MVENFAPCSTILKHDHCLAAAQLANVIVLQIEQELNSFFGGVGQTSFSTGPSGTSSPASPLSCCPCHWARVASPARSNIGMEGQISILSANSETLLSSLMGSSSILSSPSMTIWSSSSSSRSSPSCPAPRSPSAQG